MDDGSFVLAFAATLVVLFCSLVLAWISAVRRGDEGEQFAEESQSEKGVQHVVE